FKPAAPPAPGVARRVTFHHGFSSEIGAGPYGRDALLMDDLPQPPPLAPAVTGGAAQLQTGQTALGGTGTILVNDSLTYTSVQNPWRVANVLLQSGQNQCPVVRLTGAPWVIEGVVHARVNASVAFEGILVSGTEIILRGAFDTLTFSCSTLDPGEEIDNNGV